MDLRPEGCAKLSTDQLPTSVSRFPVAVYLLLTGELIIALGVGLTQPYAVVLLHEVRGMSLAVATGIFALGPVTTILGNAVAGPLIDRHGGRRIMISGLALVAAGGLTLAYGPSVVSAVAGVIITGLGWSFSAPALATRLAILAPESLRSRVYTLQYVIYNVGMAAGAALGGFAFVQARPESETGQFLLPLLWAAAACTCLAGIVLSFLAGRQMPPKQEAEDTPRGGYRRALTDGALVRILGVAALLSVVGFGVYSAAPSVMAVAADDPAALGWAGVANSAAVVAGAPIALRLAGRISARAALLWTAALWALAWAICVPTVFDTGLSTRAALTVASVLIGFGELLLAGALPTLVNDIAPDELRGRYNALSNLALTAGMATGPLLTSASVAAGGSTDHLLYVTIALAAAAALLLLLLRNPARAALHP